MPRNKVQYQKGLSLTEFLKNFGTEEQCFESLYRLRWPNGFVCPNCAHQKSCQLTVRKLTQCNRCRHQTSITAGTIFEATKLPLTTWFLGIYFITQDKKGVSAMKLHRQLGISYNAAWRMKQKLMQVMMERDGEKQLSGFVEIDDAYIGGERTGGKRGRGAEGKTPFVAAVGTTEQGEPVYIKLSVVKGFTKKAIKSWAEQHLSPETVVISDGLNCFESLGDLGYDHDRIVCGGGRASVEEPEFQWVNTILGNLKSALRGIYHSIGAKYVQRYLAEFQYMHNRRFDMPAIIPRLLHSSVRTPPMPENLLKISLA